MPSFHAATGLLAVASFLIPATLLTRASAQDHWPRFRGANAMSVAEDDPRLPLRWGKDENVLWKIEVPGLGWSSPVIWGNRVFLTSVVCDAADENEAPKAGLYLGEGRRGIPKGKHHWWTHCFEIGTGRLLWKHEAHQGAPPVGRHPKSTYAAETPVTDGERLYVLFGDLGLWCYSLEGEPLWTHRIAPKKTMADYGAAGSPVVHDDQVIVVYDNHEESFIAALDTRTGKERWRTPRDEKSTWATPLVWTHDLRTEIVVNGKNKIRSYDLSGNVLWEIGGRMSNLIIPSPFASDGLIYVTSGYFADRYRPVYAIKPGAEGDISLDHDSEETSNDFIQWYLDRAGPYNTSPIVYQNRYFTLLDRGMMTCHDARTGEEIFGRVRFPRGATFTSSPWAYHDKIFCLSERGVTYVLDATRNEFTVLGENDLDAFCMASPAVAQGKLFIRTESQLYCLTRAGHDQVPAQTPETEADDQDGRSIDSP